MLDAAEYTLENLFLQLGLDNSDDAMESFIANNQLPEGVSLKESEIWDESQREFLKEEWKKDSMWVQVIDELNLQLHRDNPS